MSEQSTSPVVSTYKIALVNHANPENPKHWLQCTSTRRKRAIAQTRKVMSGGEPLFDDQGRRIKTGNVMLFHVLPDGSMRPVSLKLKAPRIQVQEGAAPVGAAAVQVVSSADITQLGVAAEASAAPAAA